MAENLGGMGNLLGTNLLQQATRKLLQDVQSLSQTANSQVFHQTITTQTAPVPQAAAAAGNWAGTWNWGQQPTTSIGTEPATSNAKQLSVGTEEKPQVPAAAAAIGTIAAATISYGQSKMAPQLALNALQVQSEFGAPAGTTNAASFTQTRVAALGTGGKSGQTMAQNPFDALMGYSTLQQIAGQANVGASPLGRAATQQTGMASYTNPGMSMKQAANVTAWLYNPMTSMKMLNMGYPIMPRMLGANNARKVNSPGEVIAGMLLKWDRGAIPKPTQLRSWLANGQVGARNLQMLGAPQGFAGEMLAADQLYNGGAKGNLPRMKVAQVNKIFGTMSDATATEQQKQGAENELQKYGITKSEVQSVQTANAIGGESLSDQSSAFAQGLTAATSTLSTLSAKLSGAMKSSGVDKALGHVGGVTGGLKGVGGASGSSSKAGAGGWMQSVGKFTHAVGKVVSNVRGGGTRTMYDTLELSSVPSNATMVAWYPSDPRTTGSAPKGAQKISITNKAANPNYQIMDCEPGAAPSSYITTFLKAHKNAGNTGTIYTNTSSWDSVKAQVSSLPVQYWVADWTNAPETIAGSIGVQYETNSMYDTSDITDASWPGNDAGSGGGGGNGSGSSTSVTGFSSTASGMTAGLLAGESIQTSGEATTVLGAVTGDIEGGSGFYGSKGGLSAGFSSLGIMASTGLMEGTGISYANGGNAPTAASPTGTSPGGAAASSGGYDMANLLSIGKYMMAHGYSRTAAAGIAGCIAGESGGNPESSGSGGDGLIGWTPPSTGPALTGNAAADLVTQEAGIVKYNEDNDASNIAKLNAQTTAVAAADFYSQTFERPAVTDSDVRSSVANTIYSELAGVKQTGNAAGGASGATSASSTASSNSKGTGGQTSVHQLSMGSTGLGLGTGDTATMGGESELQATEGALGGSVSGLSSLGSFGISIGGSNGTTSTSGGTASQSAIAAYAETFATGLSHPYVNDGSSPTQGWDCTGFACYVWYHFGIDVPNFKPGVNHPFGCSVMWNSSFFKHSKDPVLGAFCMEAGADGTVASPGHVGIVTSLNPLQMVAAADTAEGTVYETPSGVSGYMTPSAGWPTGAVPSISSTGTLANGGGKGGVSKTAGEANPGSVTAGAAGGQFPCCADVMLVGERGPELVMDATTHQWAENMASSMACKNLSLDIGKNEIELCLPENTDLTNIDKVGETLANMLCDAIASNAKVRRAASA